MKESGNTDVITDARSSITKRKRKRQKSPAALFVAGRHCRAMAHGDGTWLTGVQWGHVGTRL